MNFLSNLRNNKNQAKREILLQIIRTIEEKNKQQKINAFKYRVAKQMYEQSIVEQKQTTPIHEQFIPVQSTTEEPVPKESVTKDSDTKESVTKDSDTKKYYLEKNNVKIRSNIKFKTNNFTIK